MIQKHVISLAILAVAGATFIGSSTQKQVAFQTAQYSWTPKETATKQNKITIGLVNPHYAENDLALYEPFRTFSKSLGADMEELITARGYTIRGPFKSWDEMVYSDKEACHIAIRIEVSPVFRVVEGGFVTSGRCQDGSTGYKLRDAVISISGKINLTAFEPITGEKVWAKSVEIPLNQTSRITSNGYCTKNIMLFIRDDAQVQNPIITLLQDGYGDILNKIDNHLDPSEFERLLPTINELKKK